MDWNQAIEKNREALKRILAALVAMVAAANGGSARGQFTFFPRTAGDTSSQALAEKSKLSPEPTLPRHLHRLMLRLLRPAEAAARRLVILAARGLVVELSPPSIAKTKPKKPPLNRRNGFGTGVVIRPGPLPEWARALAPRRSSSLSLPLLDPFKRFGFRRRSVKPSAVPRIRSFDDPRIGFFDPPRQPDPLPPSPDDPLDAGRLRRRLEAIARTLDDLPGQAKRLARWQARRDAAQEQASRAQDEYRDAAGAQNKYRDAAGAQNTYRHAGRFRRLSPMRPGRPPGWRRKPDHEVYDVLSELQSLAVWAGEHADTS